MINNDPLFEILSQKDNGPVFGRDLIKSNK